MATLAFYWEIALRRVRDCEARLDATGVSSERLAHLPANGDCNEVVEREALIATKTGIQRRPRSHGLVAKLHHSMVVPSRSTFRRPKQKTWYSHVTRLMISAADRWS